MATASIAFGPARRPARVGAIQSQIVVIDPLKLRQAALVRLLEDWANTNGLIILSISSPEEISRASNCAIVVLNVGGGSVLENATQLWIKMARSVLAADARERARGAPATLAAPRAVALPPSRPE